jgi:hypothetical protein
MESCNIVFIVISSISSLSPLNMNRPVYLQLTST